MLPAALLLAARHLRTGGAADLAAASVLLGGVLLAKLELFVACGGALGLLLLLRLRELDGARSRARLLALAAALALVLLVPVLLPVELDQTCPDGFARVENEVTFFNWVGQFLTGFGGLWVVNANLWDPSTVRVQCARHTGAARTQHAPEALLQLRTDRVRFLPYGLQGGEPGGGSRSWIEIDGNSKPLPGKVTMTVSQGTVIDDRPSSSATMGAKANTMMVSFSATWLSVKSGWPCSRSMDSMSGQGRKTRSQATSARSLSAW